MPQNCYELVWIFIIYAFIGWCTEVSYAALDRGIFVNRGFLNGPYCPIYGCGVVIVVAVLTPLKDNLLILFIGSFLLTSILEYITGYLLEKVFHNQWWDYSDKPFNIHGYVCLKFSIYWGLACTFIMDVLHPIIYKGITLMPHIVGMILICIIMTVFFVDCGITVATILKFNKRLKVMDRAMEGGIDDVGLGVLFGLDLYRYEFAGLLMHAEHLEAVHGVGPHTISVPRIKHADDIDPSAFDNGISDDTFAKICALIRVSVPYTGMIISTRESQEVRNKVLPLGVSQISGASKTSVGGYAEPEKEGEVTSEQFDVSDQRTLDEVVNWLIKLGYIPSFCTACYREGRTGDRFMALCKNMQILNCCHPNALMTLKEYLEDYASEETKRLGMELIDRELEKIPNPKVKQTAYEHIHDIAEGKRDFRF